MRDRATRRPPLRVSPLRRAIAYAVVSVVVLASTARAQLFASGTLAIDGRVFTRVYVVLSDSVTPYHPAVDVAILLVSAQGDSVVMRTDAGGSALRYLVPGEYRLVTPVVTWRGRQYAWNLPVHVRSGELRDVVLTPRNSTAPLPTLARVPAAPDSAARDDVHVAVSTGGVQPERLFAPDGRRLVIDGDDVLWEVFEEDFSRAAVSGSALPLPSRLHTLVFYRETETRQLDDYPADWLRLSNARLLTCLERARRVSP